MHSLPGSGDVHLMTRFEGDDSQLDEDSDYGNGSAKRQAPKRKIPGDCSRIKIQHA